MVGQILLQKLGRGRREAVPVGFYEVLPNRDHGYRTLSPMLLGPVMTGETHFPVSKNLENYWQGSKVFQRDLDSGGDVGFTYQESKRQMYDNPTGKRHKYSRGMRPLCTIFYDGDTEGHYQYIEARKFYCNHYEFLARKQPQYQELLNRLQGGQKLLIKGYDASLMDSHDAQLQETINRHYNDKSEPFGHEKVLFTMLCVDLQLIETAPWPNLNVERLYETTRS